jgi:outer membrane protein, heavy metal efflux system
VSGTFSVIKTKQHQAVFAHSQSSKSLFEALSPLKTLAGSEKLSMDARSNLFQVSLKYNFFGILVLTCVLPLLTAPCRLTLGQTTGSVIVTEAVPFASASFVASPQPNPPENAGSLTLDELEALALQCHPSVQRATALVNAARGRAVQVGLQPNPSLGFLGQQLGSDGLAEQYGITVDQELVVRDKLSLNRATILQEVRQLEQDVVSAQQRVLSDVRIAFFKVLRAQQQIDANRQLVEISEKGVAVAEALLKAQEVGRVDTLQAAIEVETAKIQLQVAENRYRSAWQELASVSGHPMLPPQPLVGDLFASARTFDFEQEMTRLEQNSPELFAIVASIERARTNLRRQQIETRPNVSVQGLLNWRDNGTNGDPNAGIAVTVPIPIKNHNQGAIQEARYQVYAAEQQLTRRQLELRQRLAIVFERYSNAQLQADRYRATILPKAEESLGLVRKAYESGESSFILMLTSQRTYIHSRLAYLDALETLRIAEIEIQGLLLRDALALERRE